MSRKTSILKIFCGWFVVAACFATTLTRGEAMWIFGIFFKPLENEFCWSRALLSSGYAIFLMGHGFSVLACAVIACIMKKHQLYTRHRIHA